jgi:hypothetical protein
MKRLTSIQVYERQAAQNKAANSASHTRWLHSHTVAQIAQANLARQALKRLDVKAGTKHAHRPAYYYRIKDDRAPKRPSSARALHIKDVFASGDYNHQASSEIFRQAQRSYDALSDDQKAVSVLGWLGDANVRSVMSTSTWPRKPSTHRRCRRSLGEVWDSPGLRRPIRGCSDARRGCRRPWRASTLVDAIWQPSFRSSLEKLSTFPVVSACFGCTWQTCHFDWQIDMLTYERWLACQTALLRLSSASAR